MLDGIDLLLCGFAGVSSRGWLGWSTAALLTVDGKRILVDTGSYGSRPQLLASLSTLGLDPGDIDMVVATHLHFDHIANIDLFGDAVWYLHSEELEAAEAEPNPTPLPYRNWIASQPNLVAISGAAHSLTGQVQLLHTPGHSPGSLSVLVCAGNECAALVGDAVKTRTELVSGKPNGGADPELGASSIARIRELAHRIVPGHDLPLHPDGTPIAGYADTPWIRTPSKLEIIRPTQ